MIVTQEHIATGKTIEDAISAGCAELGLDRDSVSVEVLQTPTKGFLFGIGATDAKVCLTYEVELPDPKPEPKPAARPEARREPKPKPAPAAKPVDEAAPAQSKPAQKPKTERAASQPKLASDDAAAPQSVSQKGQGAQKQRQPRPQHQPEPQPEIPEKPFEPVSGTKAEAFLREIFEVLELPVELSAATDGTLLRISLSGENMGLLIGRRGETLDALQYLTGLVAGHGDARYSKVSLDIENYRAKREETLIALAHKVAEKVLRQQKSVTLEPMNPYERRVIHSTLQNVEGVETGSVGHEPARRVVVSPVGASRTRSSGSGRSRRRRRSSGSRNAQSNSQQQAPETAFTQEVDA